MRLIHLKAAGLLTLVVLPIVAWIAWPYYLLRSAATSIDKLYAQHRPFSYRWQGVHFSPLSGQEVGCAALPDEKVNKPRIWIADAENRLGPTARSLQLSGRINLLLCQIPAAISNYKLALLLQPDEPALNLELGIAFAVDAGMGPNLESEAPLDYEAAMEAMLLSGRRNQSTEFLFDSALLFEKTWLPRQAEEKWTLAAKIENSPEWQPEVLARQSALENALGKRRREISMFSTSFSTSLDALLNHPEEARVGSELALNAAIEKWLPEVGDAPFSRPALKKLAGLLISYHHDRWLTDVLKAEPSDDSQKAFNDLSRALHFNVRGEYVQAAKAAQEAEELFEKSHNEAGKLRAEVEIVYSLDRRSEAEKCLSTLEGVQAAAQKDGYLWIETQAKLENDSCQARTRQKDVIEPRKETYEWIDHDTGGYEGLRLRALGYKTEEYVSADSRQSLWRNGEQGLRSFWSEPLPALRGYALYYTLADSARQAGNKNTAVALLREGAGLIKEQDAVALHALMLSYLGLCELEANLPQEAEASFQETEEEYGKLSPEGIETPRAESEVIHAIAQISSGKTREGLSRLQRLTGQKLIANPRRLLFPALGDAYLELNQPKEACDSYHQSIEENWENLKKIQNRAQRDNALHEIEPAWRGMTAVLLKLNRVPEALTIWEEFRSSRNVTGIQALQRIPDCPSSTSVSPFPIANPDCSSTSASPFPIANDVNVVAYAFLPGERLSGWLVNHAGIEQCWIDKQQAVALATRFAELVARKDSPPARISATGHSLYGLLMQPFADKLPQHGTIVIDAEGVLAGIPWGALEDRADHPLIERFAFCQTIGLVEALGSKDNKDNMEINFSQAPLIFGSPALQGELARQYPDLPDALREAQELSRRFPGSVLLTREEATAAAFRKYFPKYAKQFTLFHFAGHGISYGGFGALLLAPSSNAALSAQLSTQYMRANDIAGLDLSRLQLVVLSACSTGVGEKSGVVNLDSLTRAFLEAGAQRVIAANWEVDSSGTADLISAFYTQLGAGRSPAEALRQAELILRQASPHPYFWAGFQVFGRL